MPMDYPNDSDGDALRRLEADGNDMSAPMLIDFPVVIASEADARKFAAIASAKGYSVELYRADEDEEAEWDVICSRTMIPTHADVVRIQQELTELAAPFDGFCDSWGSFGNRPEA